MKYYTYVLYSERHNKYYIGQTNDLAGRIRDHNESIKTKTYTSKYRPWSLHWSLELPNRSKAMRLEKYLKNKNPKFYERLIDDEDLVEYIRNKFLNSAD